MPQFSGCPAGIARGVQTGQREPIEFEPLSVRIPVAVRLTGISRSRLYRPVQAGAFETAKIGRSTPIPYRALKALAAVRKGTPANEPRNVS